MAKITRKSKGSFKNTRKYLDGTKKINKKFQLLFQKYAQEGVDALVKATPKDSGETASKWYYKLQPWGIEYYNGNKAAGTTVAVLLQFGHLTRGGTYVEGTDYINPALKPIFNKIATEIRKEAQRL